tara:strand:+ start:148 stop:360 length:213 start_codon:yes stop_codon:yes gene_type:complete
MLRSWLEDSIKENIWSKVRFKMIILLLIIAIPIVAICHSSLFSISETETLNLLRIWPDSDFTILLLPFRS